MAITKPFQELLERLGRSEEDALTVCYQSAAQGFKVKTTKVKFADTVVETLTELEANVWYEINPSSVSGRAKADDITALSAVWIDIDFKDTGIQSEGNAHELVEIIADLIGVQPTAVVHSGHGLQPYWAIDPEEEYTQEQAAGVLARWGAFVRWVAASQGGQLDSVFDLPRIFRAPNGVNFKDAANPVRVSVDFPQSWRPVSLTELDDVLIAHGFTSVATMPAEFEMVSSHKEWEYAEEDCAWSQALLISVSATATTPKSRHGWLLQQLIKINAAHRNGCLTRQTAELLIAKLNESFKYFLSQAPAREPNPNELHSANRWAISRVEAMDNRKLNDELKGHKHTQRDANPELNEFTDTEIKNDYERAELGDIYMRSFEDFGRTDAANSHRLIHFMQNDYKFVTGVGWHKWTGSRYTLDEEKSIFQTAIEAVKFIDGMDIDPAQMKWAEASLNKDRLQNAITIAGTDSKVLVPTIELDAQANDLCTPDGIVNLRTGEVRPAIKGIDINTRQTAVSMRAVPTPMWSAFLKDTIEDEARINYVQELLGAALFGDARYHVLPIFVGTGANGKSTLVDIMAGILGDYAATMPENFLLDTTGSAHPTDIARLRGVRFAIANETRPDGKFNESRVKMLTGGDTLSARFMGQNFFDFKPTHTLFMAVNHLPEVKSGGEGFWRRLRKIDFKKTIPVEKRKENLANILVEEEGPGILQWLVEGAVRITNQGFTEPLEVLMSTQEYRHEEDHIAKFLDEKTILSDISSVTKTMLYNAYRDWCEQNGEKAIPQNALSREIKSRLGVRESETAGYKMFIGIELIKLGAANNDATIKDILGAEDKDAYWDR